MEKTEALKELWQLVFGDEREWLDAWFTRFYREELTAVLYEGERLAASAYVLPVGTFEDKPCAFIYAVGVHPELRGRGLGVQVTRLAAALAKKAGFGCIALHPAQYGLFRFYEKHCGFHTAFTRKEERLFFPAHTLFTETCRSEDYLAVRERLLAGRAHITPSLDILDWFTFSGGRLYCGGDWCAAAEDGEDCGQFYELLCGAEHPSPETLAGMTERREALVFTPGGAIPTGMVYGDAPDTGCWFGLTLE